ncbi:MAG: hypothetical protein XD48_2399, partial [Archaeoglobus fulgidus]
LIPPFNPTFPQYLSIVTIARLISKRFKYMKGLLNQGGGGLADAVAFPPPKKWEDLYSGR